MLRFERFLLSRVKYVYVQENLSFIRVTFILTVPILPTMTSYNALPSAHNVRNERQLCIGFNRNQVTTNGNYTTWSKDPWAKQAWAKLLLWFPLNLKVTTKIRITMYTCNHNTPSEKTISLPLARTEERHFLKNIFLKFPYFTIIMFGMVIHFNKYESFPPMEVLFQFGWNWPGGSFAIISISKGMCP